MITPSAVTVIISFPAGARRSWRLRDRKNAVLTSAQSARFLGGAAHGSREHRREENRQPGSGHMDHGNTEQRDHRYRVPRTSTARSRTARRGISLGSCDLSPTGPAGPEERAGEGLTERPRLGQLMRGDFRASYVPCTQALHLAQDATPPLLLIPTRLIHRESRPLRGRWPGPSFSPACSAEQSSRWALASPELIDRRGALALAVVSVNLTEQGDASAPEMSALKAGSGCVTLDTCATSRSASCMRRRGESSTPPRRGGHHLMRRRGVAVAELRAVTPANT